MIAMIKKIYFTDNTGKLELLELPYSVGLVRAQTLAIAFIGHNCNDHGFIKFKLCLIARWKRRRSDCNTPLAAEGTSDSSARGVASDGDDEDDSIAVHANGDPAIKRVGR